MKRLEVFLLPLDGMPVHHRSLSHNLLGFSQQFTGIHLHIQVERGAVRVKCLAQEPSTMSPARARTRTARSGVERSHHDSTMSPTKKIRKQKVHFKQLINPEGLNGHAHNAKHVLSFATLRKYRDQNDPSISLIISPAPQPMRYTA